MQAIKSTISTPTAIDYINEIANYANRGFEHLDGLAGRDYIEEHKNKVDAMRAKLIEFVENHGSTPFSGE